MIDCARETGATDALVTLAAGDLVAVVDRVGDFAGHTAEWFISTAEIIGLDWTLAPDSFRVRMTLDQERLGSTTS